MANYKFKNSLLRYLGLDINKSYSINDIRLKIKNKKIDQQEFKKNFPSYSGCGCGSCPVDLDKLVTYIKKEFILRSDKPDCDYYEFNQKPISVNFISL